jgi:autotransporter-associated beta strand protein
VTAPTAASANSGGAPLAPDATLATREWANVGSDWATGANWVGGTAPVSSVTTDIASFGSTGGSAVNPNLAANRSINGISFLSGAFAYTLGATGGAILTIGTGGITDSATNTETFGSTFTLAPSASQSWTSNSGATLAFNGVVDLNNSSAAARTLTLTGAGDFTFNSTSVIQNSFAASTGNLTYSGTGTLTLSGTNTYNGTTTVISGSVGIGNNSAFGTSLLTLGGTSANTPTIFASSAARTISNNVSLAAVGTGTATISGSNDLTINGSVTGTGASRTLTVNNSGNTTLSNVFLTDTATAGRTLTIAGSGNVTIGGVIANNSTNNAIADNLAFTGTGTLTLTNTNTYTGTTTVGSSNGANAGTLKLSGSGTISNAATTVFGGALDLNGTTQTITTLSLGSGASGSTATVSIGAGELKLGGDVTYDSSNNPNGATISSTTGKLSLLGDRNFVVGNSSAATNDLTVSAIIQNGDATARALTKSNTGTLVLSGANTYTGKTSVANGILSVASLNSVAGGSASSNLGAPITVANGTIDLGGGGAQGTLTYTGTGETTDRVINMSGTTGGARIDQSGTGLLKFTSNSTATGSGVKVLTLQGSTAGTGEFAGRITDSGGGATSLTKSGTGTWTLSNATNNFTGSTTISASGGTLVAAVGTLVSTSSVTVNSGGTLLLSGNGRHIGANTPVTLAGGTFATGGFSEPNGGAGGLAANAIGSLTLTSNSTIDFGLSNTSVLEFSGLGAHTAGTGSDLLITNWNGNPLLGGSGDRLLFIGLGTDFVTKYAQSDVTFNNDAAGYAIVQFDIAGNPYYEVTAIPEPSTWIGGALTVAALGWSQRKRLKKLLSRNSKVENILLPTF